MNENDILQKIAEQDPDAIRYLVEQYQSLVIGICFRFVGNQQDAEDIAQDVFLQAYKSLKKFREEAKLSTWLYRIAVNRSLNYIRDNKKKRWLISLNSQFEDDTEREIEAPIDQKDQPDEHLEEKERTQILLKAIDSLPDKQRIAFTLHKFQGLKYQEVADIMQQSIPSIESLIHRAKMNLQKRLIKILKQL